MPGKGATCRSKQLKAKSVNESANSEEESLLVPNNESKQTKRKVRESKDGGKQTPQKKRKSERSCKQANKAQSAKIVDDDDFLLMEVEEQRTEFCSDDETEFEGSQVNQFPGGVEEEPLPLDHANDDDEVILNSRNNNAMVDLNRRSVPGCSNVARGEPVQMSQPCGIQGHEIGSLPTNDQIVNSAAES